MYKRNQIEEAIAQQIGERDAEPSQELRTRLKRLLDADRELGRVARSKDPEEANFAFYSSESPGKGAEVEFSEYETFALLTSLRLLMHGFPQGFAVEILRRVRPDLEVEHARFMRLDEAKLFDQEAIRKQARPGDMAFNVISPSFLMVVGREGGLAGSVCPSVPKLWEFAGKYPRQPWTIFELVEPAFSLRRRLGQTEPRRRGRGG
jgi:hypothetical protein